MTTFRIPLLGDTFLAGDVITSEALAGLVGQTPRVTVNFDQSRPLGRATVTAAEEKDGALYLTVDFDDPRTAEALTSAATEVLSLDPEEAVPDPVPGTIGYRIADAEVIDPVKGLRRFKGEGMRLHEVGPYSWPEPASPAGGAE